MKKDFSNMAPKAGLTLSIFAQKSGHYSYYNSITTLLAPFFNKIIIYGSPEIATNIAKTSDQLEIVTASIEEHFRSNLPKMFQADLLILEEAYNRPHLQKYYSALRKNKKCKVLLTIHNASTWLNPPEDFTIHFFRTRIWRRMILKKIDGIIVIAESIKNFIVQSKLTELPVMHIPFALISETLPPKSSKLDNRLYTFVVPGFINKERKNYDILIKVFSNLWERGINIKLVLLGRLPKDDIKSDFGLTLANASHKYPGKLTYFDKFLPDTTFNKELALADVLISNVYTFFMNDGLEIYGISKETGITFLMLEHSLPTLVPEDYLVPKSFDNYCIKYSEATMENEILKLLETDVLNSKKVQLNSDRERIRKRQMIIDTTLIEILNSLT